MLDKKTTERIENSVNMAGVNSLKTGVTFIKNSLEGRFTDNEVEEYVVDLITESLYSKVFKPTSSR